MSNAGGRSFGAAGTGARVPAPGLARGLVGAILCVTGCAADPVPFVPDGGREVGICPATAPPPSAAVDLFPPEIPFAGETRLLTSAGGMALAYSTQRSASAFATDPVSFRRYDRGVWSPAEAFPEPIHLAGTLQGTISPTGDTMFVWPSLDDSVDPNSVNVHARTLARDGTWSDQMTVGDTSVGWWQDPTLPDIAVASSGTLSMIAWTRVDPTAVDSRRTLWANQRRAPQDWAAPGAVSPGETTASILAARADGTARAVWSSSATDGTTALLIARWDDGWNAPEVIDQAGADTRFDVGAPGTGLELAPSGEIVIVYALTTATGTALRAARSADGGDWTTDTLVASLPVAASWRRVANSAGEVLVTWGSPPDQALNATIYSPGSGWTAVNTFSDVRNDAAVIALAGDGRAAIADVAAASPSAECDARTVVRVRRYLPASGWASPEVIDDAVTVRSVTALGYAGDDLLVLWQRGTGETYARSMI